MSRKRARRRKVPATPQRPDRTVDRMGWMTFEAYENNPVAQSYPVQMSHCTATGRTFVKPVDDRYSNRPDGELRERLEMVCAMLFQIGTIPAVDPDRHLGRQVEMLENILEFDLSPPCGCPPYRPAAKA